MNEWKTIPPNTRVRPNLATWRKSDIDDTLTDYSCYGALITEDWGRIECIVGYCVVVGEFGDEYILPRYYKEV